MTININLKNEIDNSYQIFIEDLKELTIDKKVAIITNETISNLHINKILEKIKAKELFVVTVGDGENFKNIQTIEFILDKLFENRLNRKSLLIAFGGGVIGDMTGFCASIFQRGIDFIQIPTTLLSMVDASVGGKTGVNSKYGKNLIGAFHQPKAVYIDTSWLKTLPKREFGAGVAELVKMAVMFDSEFFVWLENNSLLEEQNLQYAIKKSVEIKADVVSKDEKETGVRAVLNYGHTFGHVIEMQTKYTKFLHGEAVSMGMMMANELSKNLDLFSEDEYKRVETLLQKYDIPTQYEIENLEVFYDAFFLDKKSTDNKIKFILPNGLGKFKMSDNIEKELVLKALSKFKKSNN